MEYDESEDLDDEASLRRVEQGGIPLLAQRRLSELQHGAGAFTSDLSVADFALCHQLGLTPLSQVMGTSVYQVGYQPTGYTGGYGRTSSNVLFGAARELGELPVLTRAWNEARERAFSRLAEEAASVGADAVVGVEVRSGVAAWTEVPGAIEYVVTGTAVRRDRTGGSGDRTAGGGDRTAGGGDQAARGGDRLAGGRSGRPGGLVLTELSVADYAKLLLAGVEPLGIVAWTSVFFISLLYFQAEREERGLGGMFAAGSSFQNFEYRGATQAFYGARETVIERMNQQARRLEASGIVGVRISHTIRGTEGGGGGPGAGGLIASFSALGTAVHEVDATPQAPMLKLDLS